MNTERSYSVNAIPVELIRPYIYYLRDKSNITTMTVSKLNQTTYIGDFYGLLSSMTIDSRIWTATLLINDYSHPGEYRGSETILTMDVEPVLRIIQSLLPVRQR